MNKQLLALAGVALLAISAVAAPPGAVRRLGSGVDFRTPMSDTEQPGSPVLTPRPASFFVPGNEAAQDIKVPMMSPAQAAGDVNLMGFVASAAGSYTGYMYNVPFREGMTFNQASTMTIYNSWGGVKAGDTYYTVFQIPMGSMAYNYMYSYNTTTWFMGTTKMLPDFQLFATAQAADPATDAVYGCYMKADRSQGYEFGIADFANGTRSTISQISGAWACMAFDGEGRLLAIDVDGNLLEVEKATGATTLIGNTGVTTQYIAGMTYDSKNGRLLRAVCNEGSSALYAVDPATGASTLLYTFPGNEDVLGMFIGAPLAADDAPDAPANLKVEFPLGGMAGKVSFDIPSTTFGGAAGEGDVTYTVTLNGYTTLATGTSGFGQSVEADVTAPYAGDHTITVALSNAAGTSPKASVKTYVGMGSPKIPVPYVTVDGCNVTLEWAPVTESYNAGYFDPSKVTYTVTRWKDLEQTVVAEHIYECTFSETLEMPETLTSYHYTVVAEYEGNVSGWGQTLFFTLGEVQVPYLNDFSSVQPLQYYTAIDANNDNVCWSQGGGGAMIYSTSGDVALDDWLFTPGIRTEAGKKYLMEFGFRTLQLYSPNQADIEVKCGNTNSVAAMTGTLVPRTAINLLAEKHFTGIYEATADGPLYIGFHAVSDNANWPVVDYISMRSADIPAAVSDFEVIRGAYGTMQCKVKFKAPTLTAAGEPLASISKLELKRAGVIIKTWDNPAPGENLEFDDNINNTPGNFMWTATAFGDAGEGVAADKIAYIGIAAPAKPETITAVEEGNTGKVTMQWSPVEYDVNGNWLEPQDRKYRILLNGSYFDNNPEITDNSYTMQVTQGDEQVFCLPGIQIYNAVSSNVAYATPSFPVGKPYESYAESFEGGVSHHSTGFFNTNSTAIWSTVPDGYYGDLSSADADGGFIVLSSAEAVPGAGSSMNLGKFDLSAMEKAAVSFMIANTNDGQHHNTNTVEVLVNSGNGFVSVETITLTDCELTELGKPVEWFKKKVDLSSYRNGVIQIAIRGTLINYGFLGIDKIKVAPALDHNLTITGLSAADKISIGDKLRFTALIENNGNNAASGYKVRLLCGDKEVAVADGPELEADASGSVIFIYEPDIFSDPQCEFRAVVEYDADEDISDNEATHSVTVNLPAYPAPENVKATAETGKVSLVWDEPTAEMPAEPVDESFENGHDGDVDTYEGWTFIDRDGQVQSGIANVSTAAKAYAVCANYNDGYFFNIQAHSGEFFLATGANANGDIASDDWAISPRLSGKAQTVTLYARSLFDEDGGESFKLMYSTGSLDPDDFIEVRREDGVPAPWTQYSFDLPEGAMYFAIVCVSQYQYMFMVDDVHYEPAGAGDGLSLMGYNVYRERVKANEAVVEEQVYSDTPETSGTYVYAVTALYSIGESAPAFSAPVAFESSGLDEAFAAGISVSAAHGLITVSGAEGSAISVCGVDGRTVAAVASASAVTEISVQPGSYLVTVGSLTFKLMVP